MRPHRAYGDVGEAAKQQPRTENQDGRQGRLRPHQDPAGPHRTPRDAAAPPSPGQRRPGGSRAREPGGEHAEEERRTGGHRQRVCEGGSVHRERRPGRERRLHACREDRDRDPRGREAEDRAPSLVISPKLEKLYESLGLDESLKPNTGTTPQSIPWVRVHNLPDYVYFDHRAHVTAGVTCQRCHGAVETMDKLYLTPDTIWWPWGLPSAKPEMGWCIDCHRENGATQDCYACHY